jgi:hypothetical protein
MTDELENVEDVEIKTYEPKCSVCGVKVTCSCVDLTDTNVKKWPCYKRHGTFEFPQSGLALTPTGVYMAHVCSIECVSEMYTPDDTIKEVLERSGPVAEKKKKKIEPKLLGVENNHMKIEKSMTEVSIA